VLDAAEDAITCSSQDLCLTSGYKCPLTFITRKKLKFEVMYPNKTPEAPNQLPNSTLFNSRTPSASDCGRCWILRGSRLRVSLRVQPPEFDKGLFLKTVEFFLHRVKSRFECRRFFFYFAQSFALVFRLCHL
jgi:hypothetical protein